MAIANRSYETQVSLKRLEQGKRGDKITPAEMDALAGRPCWESKTTGYRYVASAMKACLTERNIYWVRNKTAGVYECAQVPVAIAASGSYVGKARRAAKKSLQVSASVRSDEMTEEQGREHRLHTTLAGIIVNSTSTHTKKAVTGRSIHELEPAQLRKIVTGE